MSINMKRVIFLLLSMTSFCSVAGFQALANFGDNPGELTASYLKPAQATNKLVILLHGCAQNGELLAQQSGFVALAKQHKFILLIPQQSKKNNVKSCFNWFSALDTTKDKGESLSLFNMIATLKNQTTTHHIYIAGVSAGGAMASAMLVNYPELFKSGAVIAGLPYPCADNLAKAISCMRNGPLQTAPTLTDYIKKQQPQPVNWPTLTVWTGNKDKVVNTINSSVLAQQWAGLFAQNITSKVINKDDYQITQWQVDNSKVVVELAEFKKLGHGMMVNPDTEKGGEVAPFLLAAPLSSAKQIINFWGLTKKPTTININH